MCNINKAEVAYRKKAMWAGIGISAVLLIALVALSAPVLTRLVLFVPIYVAAIGYLQVKNKFCVAYGSSGKQNASEGSDTASVIEDDAALAVDVFAELEEHGETHVFPVWADSDKLLDKGRDCGVFGIDHEADWAVEGETNELIDRVCHCCRE